MTGYSINSNMFQPVAMLPRQKKNQGQEFASPFELSLQNFLSIFDSGVVPNQDMVKDKTVKTKALQFGLMPVTSKKGDEITKSFINTQKQEVLNIKYKEGSQFKFTVLHGNDAGAGVRIEPKDPAYQGLRITVPAGKSFSIPGEFDVKVHKEPLPCTANPTKGELYKTVPSKTDKPENELIVYTSKANYQDATTEVASKYFEQGLYDRVSIDKDALSNNFNKKYNAVIPLAGDGNRMKLITLGTAGKISKPIMQLPYQDGHLVHNIMDSLSKSNVLGKGTEVKFFGEDTAMGSASGFVSALRSGDLSTDKPAVIAMSDQYSDMKVSEAITKDFENKTSALTIAGIPVEAKETSRLGIIGMDPDTLEVKNFIEKPKTLKEAAPGKIPGTDKYLANIAMYIFHPAALKAIKAKADSGDWDKFIEVDYAKHIIPLVKEKAEKGELKDDNGTSLKLYASIAKSQNAEGKTVDCKWNDLGTTSAYTQMFLKDVNDMNIPENQRKEIKQNVVNGALCLPEATDMFKQLCAETGAKFPEGIFVAAKV